MALLSITFLVILLTSGIEVNANDISEGKMQLPHSYEVSIKFANRHFCNGAIISSRHILTASHCFYQNGVKYSDSMYKYMSVVSGSNANLLDGGKIHRIKNVTTYHDLNNSIKDFWMDIALVTIDSEILYTALEQPIELSDVDVSETDIRARMSIWTSPVDSLQTVEVYLLSQAKCMEKLKGKFLGEQDSKICGYTRTGRGLCLNNDGSPLVQNGKIIGIASSSEGCKNGNPDIYINVYKNLDFINKAIIQNL